MPLIYREENKFILGHLFQEEQNHLLINRLIILPKKLKN